MCCNENGMGYEQQSLSSSFGNCSTNWRLCSNYVMVQMKSPMWDVGGWKIVPAAVSRTWWDHHISASWRLSQAGPVRTKPSVWRQHLAHLFCRKSLSICTQTWPNPFFEPRSDFCMRCQVIPVASWGCTKLRSRQLFPPNGAESRENKMAGIDRSAR